MEKRKEFGGDALGFGRGWKKLMIEKNKKHDKKIITLL